MTACKGLQLSPRMGTLVIDGVSLNCPAWNVLDLKPLWEGPDLRGTDRIVPGSAGVLAYPRRPTVSRRTLQMLITGDVDYPTYTTSVDAAISLFANLAALRGNVTDPTGGDGTRLAQLTVPGGTVKSGRVHVISLLLGAQQTAHVRATLTLDIMAGALS